MKVELPAGDHLHFLHNTGVAQLVEHRSPKPRAVGSNPTTRAKGKKTCQVSKHTFLSRTTNS